MLTLTLTALLLADTARSIPPRLPIPHVKRQTITGPNGYQFNVLEHLAGIAPYFDSPGVQLNPAPPQGCEVSTAAYLVRHSNIYANGFDYETYLEPFISKLANFTDRQAFSNVSNLAFLTNWTTPINNATEQVEKLTPSGAQAASAFGSIIANIYPTLAPFNSSGNGSSFKVWAATAERSLDSARAFTQGAFSQNGSQLVAVDEGEQASANSLAPHESCPNFEGSAGSVQSGQFMGIYTAPIVQRLNAALPSFNFTALDVVAMQELCGYETVIRNSSGFCNAFDEVDWLGFEYMNDLMYFYSIGYGNPIGPQLGMPWVDATTALLNSQNNTQNLYISFTHREEPPLALTALGLFNNSAYTPALNVNTTMPSTEINFGRQWRTSDILPFLGHVALERLECPGLQAPNSGDSTAGTAGNSTSSAGTSTFVRTLVNGAPIPFPACQDGPGGSCALGNFVQYIQERSQRYGDFDTACGVNATNATNALTIYQA